MGKYGHPWYMEFGNHNKGTYSVKRKSIYNVYSKVEGNYRSNLRRKARCVFSSYDVMRYCEVCGSLEDLHAHHHQGYDGDNIYKVIWLCASHHHMIHDLDNAKKNVSDLMKVAETKYKLLHT